MTTKFAALATPLRKNFAPALKSEIAPDVNQIAVSHSAALSSKLNPLTKAVVNCSQSWAAGSAVRSLQRQEIEATARVAETAIAIAESQVKKALISNALPATAALLTTLAARAQQADAALTNTAQAAAQAILANRSATRQALEESYREGQVSEQERDALIAQAYDDHSGDHQRMRGRLETCREVIDVLFAHSSHHLAIGVDQPAA